MAQRIYQTSKDGTSKDGTSRWCSVVLARNVAARPQLAAHYDGEYASASGDGDTPQVLVQDVELVRELVVRLAGKPVLVGEPVESRVELQVVLQNDPNKEPLPEDAVESVVVFAAPMERLLLPAVLF